MQRVCIESLAKQQLKLAACQPGRRVAADTVVGGHERVLRQTVVAVTEGNRLGQQSNCVESTAYVISGELRMTAGDSSSIVHSGDLVKIPGTSWDLQAVADSAVLLSVAMLSTAADDAHLPGEETGAASVATGGR